MEQLQAPKSKHQRSSKSQADVPHLFLQILYHSFRAGVNLKLLENILQVPMHSPDADAKSVGDFFVQVAFAQTTENFLFPRREFSYLMDLVAGLEKSGDVAKGIPDLLDNLLRRKRSFGQQSSDRLQHLHRRSAFQQITGSPAGS